MEERERTILLGLVLKRVANFDISAFKGRLILQKTVYLLQSFGLNLEYKFSWYIHGPYSPDLTRDAFKLQPIYQDLPLINFENSPLESLLKNFQEFLGQNKDDPDWLEQVACTHFLKTLNPKADKTTIIESVVSHEYHFTRAQCQRAWDYLIKKGLITEKEN